MSFQASASRVAIDITRQSADKALVEFARQAGLSVLFPTEHINQITTNAVQGTYEVEEALAILLHSTGLTAELGKSGVLTVKITDELRSSLMSTKKNRSWMPSIISSLATIFAGRGHMVHAQESPSDSGKLQEIVVTAQKREQRLQDVPVPVTAISADSLLDSNQVRLQDYYARVPGLSFTPADLRGGARLTIRGITTGGLTNPTVGITVDDVPYGSSSNTGIGYEVPDLDPSDLQRIEVLRGPQGTLYGASSIGGLLKFVTVDPSTAGVSGRVQADVDAAHNGDQAGYGARGAVNMPLTDTLALRASGFTRRDPGYIDNVETGESGINRTDVYGGRLSGLWRPSDVLSVKLSALFQDSKRGGSSDVDIEPGLGDLQQSTLRGTGKYDKKVEVYSANLAANLAAVNLASITSYSRNTLFDSIDYTNVFGGLTNIFFGVQATPYLDHVETRKFTQEIRLSSSAGPRFDWLVGGFYNHEDTDAATDILAANAATGASVGSVVHLTQPTTFAEYAAFADVTFHVTDRFDVQLGGRESENRQTSITSYEGIYASTFLGSSPFIYPKLDTKENSFTYLLTPEFKISPDWMVYARLASGYRPGGPNAIAAIVNLPRHYDPDKTQNYEIGTKGNFLNHRVSFDASVYYIDWKDIQIFVVDKSSGQGYNANGSRAKSQGIELSMESRPLTGLTISALVALNDAKLTQPFPPTSTASGQSGDRLPYSSKFSANVAFDEEVPLTGAVTGFLAGSLSYVGNRDGVFGSPLAPQRQVFPAYAQTDLRAGVRVDSWTVNLFANNIADKRGVLTGGLGTTFPYAFTYIQPRTLGLSASKTF
jgi:iron complex outermembrane receptor protein